MIVGVLGATGFVGRRLVPALLSAGHDVVALTRRPAEYLGPGRPAAADLDDASSLPAALAGLDAAYLLTHALGTPEFEQREAEQARTLAAAAAGAGLGQLVFLSGLGTGELSPHLRSRRTVEQLLREGPTPVTVVRAGIVIGAGSAGWEMLRQMLDVLPVMVADLRARHLHQPIAAADAVGYLVDVLGRTDCLDATVEIGGADVLRFSEMLQRTAGLTDRTQLVQVPWVPTALAAFGVGLMTDVDGATARDLLGSMANDSVVTDSAAADRLGRRVLGFDDAVRSALAEPAA